MSEIPPTALRLRDLAAVAGLSPSGVSRALNGDPTMSKRTRERVQELAAQMGYKPNAAARSLRESGKPDRSTTFRGTLGYLISQHEDTQMRGKHGRERFPWHFEVIQRAQLLGYSVDTFVVNEGEESHHVNRVLRARGIRGLIISAAHHNPRDYPISWEGFSAVSLHAEPSAHFLHNLSVPYFQDTYDAARHLLARGYQRVGFFMVGNVLDSFLGGYEVAVGRAGQPVLPVLTQEHFQGRPFLAWLKRTRPDVVLTTSGMEVVEALRRSGRTIPEEIGVCVTDDIDEPGYLSGMRQPRRQLCRWAVDSLHAMLTHNEIGPPTDPVEIHFPSRWTEGKTLKSRSLSTSGKSSPIVHAPTADRSVNFAPGAISREPSPGLFSRRNNLP